MDQGPNEAPTHTATDTSAHEPTSAEGGKRSSVWRRVGLWGALALFLGVLAAWIAQMLWQEMDHSERQARYFSDWASRLTFRLQDQPVQGNAYPKTGPYDERLGYTRIPDFVKRLTERGLTVTHQAEQSVDLRDYIGDGFYPPTHERSQAGLRVQDCRKSELFAFEAPRQVYASFEAIPEVVARTLAFIENREIVDAKSPTHNPAIEWPRLGKAVLDQFVELANDDHSSAGGSTLATQAEKFRHSRDGRTNSFSDKYHQMVSASVRAYRDGPYTVEARKRILVDYFNGLPLGAQRGWGEVHGVNDGLTAWFGTNAEEANRLLHQPLDQAEGQYARAMAFRELLALMIAQRRPSHYFGSGMPQLQAMTASYLRLLADAGVITPTLRDLATQVPLQVRVPDLTELRSPQEFGERKAAMALRVQLSNWLDVPRFYDLERLDLAVESTIDSELQRKVTDYLVSLADPQVAGAAGLRSKQLLESGDPAQLLYSFTLYERGEGVNYVRVQADNLDQPFDVNGGAKLELGSTAKLRTLTTYLQIVAELYEKYEKLDREALLAVPVHAKDPLTRFVVDYLLSDKKERSLRAIMESAMDRKYAVGAGEAFNTGGGRHVFSNFGKLSAAAMPLWSATAQSVNLVFVRLMKDVVYHHLFRPESKVAPILDDENHPQRQELLRLYVEKDGNRHLRSHFKRWQGMPGEEVAARMADSVYRTEPRLAVIYRSILPEAPFEAFAAFVRKQMQGSPLGDEDLMKLYERHAPGNYTLQDRGYLSRIHPLGLWVAGYLQKHPKATFEQVVEAGAYERDAAYRWLLNSKRLGTQNSRIYQLLEIGAFTEIQRRWAKVGYPFDTLVPSFGTALGSSGDRPAALAELMGIIVNDGIRQPSVHMGRLHFAPGTPYEVMLERTAPPAPERVMPAEVAATLRKALGLVVSDGTARRLYGAFNLPGKAVTVGGKTGTGDNRLNTYTRGGGLLTSKVMSRTATFVFYIGDRHFGTLTAFVLGQAAQGYKFTSALPVQILRNVSGMVRPSLTSHPGQVCDYKTDAVVQPTTAGAGALMAPTAAVAASMARPASGPTAGPAASAPLVAVPASGR